MKYHWRSTLILPHLLNKITQENVREQTVRNSKKLVKQFRQKKQSWLTSTIKFTNWFITIFREHSHFLLLGISQIICLRDSIKIPNWYFRRYVYDFFFIIFSSGFGWGSLRMFKKRSIVAAVVVSDSWLIFRWWLAETKGWSFMRHKPNKAKIIVTIEMKPRYLKIQANNFPLQ